MSWFQKDAGITKQTNGTTATGASPGARLIPQTAFETQLKLGSGDARLSAGAATNVQLSLAAALVGHWADTGGSYSVATSPGSSVTAANRSAHIDPPLPGINLPGFIDHLDGANLRTGPAELGGTPLLPKPLPPGTRVFVSGQHPRTANWWYVTAFLPGTLARGYVQEIQPGVSRVNTDLPEPGAKLHLIRPGDTVEKLAKQEFSASIADGRDLRYYENALLAVNKDKGRVGIIGTYQDPNLFGGGANNIQLVAGHLIWLLSPGYAKQLAGVIPSGSLTGGLWAKAKRGLRHIEDILQSVTGAPRHFGAVAGEYAALIKDHLPEIIGITAGFIAAEAASAFLAATPTGVGQLAAVLIQLTLAAFGVAGAVQAGVQALAHGKKWLTLAWTAKGEPTQIVEASKEFLRMLVQIALAALAALGARGNYNRALSIAENIKVPSLKVGEAVEQQRTEPPSPGEGEQLGLCFPEGTPVHTTRGLRPIETLRVGDEVLAWNGTWGRTVRAAVTACHIGLTLELATVKAGDTTVRATPAHRFYRADARRWVAASTLEAGHLLLGPRGPCHTTRVICETLSAGVAVYNLTVAALHTYFVGEEGLLVHNDPTPTPTQLPEKVIYNENGLRVWHNYGNTARAPGTPIEHGPIHYHVSYKGKEYKLFPSGKPLRNSPEPPDAVKEVFRENRSRFNNIAKRIGKWYRTFTSKCG